MAVNVQSNFLYNANGFLDERHTIVNKPEDLASWFDNENEDEIVVIPDGFEIRVEGVWYVYEPMKEKNPVTGYFHPRLTDDRIKNLLPGVINVGNIIEYVD